MTDMTLIIANILSFHASKCQEDKGAFSDWSEIQAEAQEMLSNVWLDWAMCGVETVLMDAEDKTE